MIIFYEANIKKGIFRDAVGNCADLLKRLKNESEIIIIGSGCEAQDTYDFLLKNNIDICCFVNENYSERMHRLFGKEILTSLDARKKYKNPIFIECMSKHSAWGFGATDIYDYFGYKRNERFYLFRDYVDITRNSLLDILKDKKVVLLGDTYLCIYLYEFLEKNMISVIGSLEYEMQNSSCKKLPVIHIDDVNQETICLIVIPEYFEQGQKQRQNVKKKKMISYLKANGLNNYSDYFSYTDAFIEIDGKDNNKYTKDVLMPKKVILGKIESHCGNAFFRGGVVG